jgi:hypothetical protein
MPRKRSFADHEVADAINQLVQNGIQPTLRRVHTRICGEPAKVPSLTSVLSSYRRCLCANIPTENPLILAAARRLRTPLLGWEQRFALAGLIEHMASDMRTAADDLDVEAGRMRSSTEVGEPYQAAARIISAARQKLVRPRF